MTDVEIIEALNVRVTELLAALEKIRADRDELATLLLETIAEADQLRCALTRLTLQGINPKMLQ